MVRKETDHVLNSFLERLYVLRIQLLHSRSTWSSKFNRLKVNDGAQILAVVIPIFLNLMTDK